MKLIGVHGLPGIERVRMFLNEKGLTVPVESPEDYFQSGDTSHGMLFDDVMGGQPLLELDDGVHVIGASAIQIYVDGRFPKPVLLGHTHLERANVEMWQRLIENRLLSPLAVFCYHDFLAADHADNRSSDVEMDDNVAVDISDLNASRTRVTNATQSRAWGRRNLGFVRDAIRDFDKRLATTDFIAGSDYSAADITLQACLNFANVLDLTLTDKYAHITRWQAVVRGRQASDAGHVSLADARLPSVARDVVVKPRPGLARGYKPTAVPKRVFVVDLEGHFRYANEAALEMYGVTAESNNGRHIAEEIGAKYFDRVVQRVLERCARGETLNRRVWVHFSGGEKRCVEAEYSPWFNADGVIDGMMVIAEDVHRYSFLSESRSVEPDMQRTRLMDSFLGSTRDRVIVLSKDGHWLYANAATLDFYRATIDEIAGHHLSEWVGSDYFHDVIEPSLDACFAGESGTTWGGYNSPSGRFETVEFDYSPYHEPDGRITGAILQTRAVSLMPRPALADSPAPVNVADLDMGRLLFTASILGSRGEHRVSVMDAVGNFIHVNETVQNIWGVPARDLVGQHVGDFVGSEYFEGVIKPGIQRCLAGEHVYEKVLAPTGSGELQPATLEMFPYAEHPGKEDARVVIARLRITPEAEANAALAAAPSEPASVPPTADSA